MRRDKDMGRVKIKLKIFKYTKKSHKVILGMGSLVKLKMKKSF